MADLVAKGIRAMPDAVSLVRECRIVIVAVKPHQVEEVLGSVRDALTADKVVVSVAAGVTLEQLGDAVGGRCAVARCMPNTPALVGQGVFALCLDRVPSQDDRSELVALFGRLGMSLVLPEGRFAAFSALMGAGPAYVFAMMQGLVQAGVTLGFPHAQSRAMVTALFQGASAMAAESSAPLHQMRDDVCSPGGLTIAGVNHLDRCGLTGILVDAVLAADAKGRAMEAPTGR
jgi:pyrroline-5-carboxylate reductase